MPTRQDDSVELGHIDGGQGLWRLKFACDVLKVLLEVLDLFLVAHDFRVQRARVHGGLLSAGAGDSNFCTGGFEGAVGHHEFLGPDARGVLGAVGEFKGVGC
ncbi:hypothetical protein D3C73_1467780 [compost metagenome]